MDKLKKARSVHRTAFTRTLTTLNAELTKDAVDMTQVQALFNILEEKSKVLFAEDQKILELALDSDMSEADVNKETEGFEEYKAKFQIAKVSVAQLIQAKVRAEQPAPVVQGNVTNQPPLLIENTWKYKLPKIELRKFNGEPVEWLKFWSVFKRIHEDASLSNEEKFQYLMQATVDNSRASEFVNSFPPTAENYIKVIDGLKSRFGREDLLVEVYVRELIKLVLSKSKGTLTSVYDKLETHLRSLESLGLTSAMYAAMLYPLVESSLPEEILRAWQRKGNAGNTAVQSLEGLMKFLEGEVQSEERISMARVGFDPLRESQPLEPIGKAEKHKKPVSHPNASVATAAGLLVAKETQVNACIFCQESHDNASCHQAKHMSMSSRLAIAKEKRACYVCLKVGHSAKFCKSKVKCPWCGRKHVLLMCRELSRDGATVDENKEASKKVESLTTLACNNASYGVEVHLQTLRVKLKGPSGESVVRALIDPGSHKTYILSRVAEKLKLEKAGQETMIHLLFSGVTTAPRYHEKYKVSVSSLDGKYECYITALHEEIICQRLPTVLAGAWSRTLQDSEIYLTDTGGSEHISLLIGADIAGLLYTGKIHQFNDGPTALETKLGWVIMGRNSGSAIIREDAALTVLSMYNHEAKVSDLWDLDVLGIRDPVETLTKEAHQANVKQRFQETICFNNERRYEVSLPWKENHPPLTGNRMAAEKRLLALTKKLRDENLYAEYEAVFDSWMEAGIIEECTNATDAKSEYYLPHRHVVKRNSTTPVRPVFDASACSRDGPSLNQCLETGPNLIELIPSTLLRFMLNKIGVIADITKAFLQVGVIAVDRDFLKFLWWSKTAPFKMIVYRHRRVVFGVNSSPFLLEATIEYHLEKSRENAESQEKADVIAKLLKSFYVDNCVTSVETEEQRVIFQENSTEIMNQGGFELRGWEYTSMSQEQDISSVLGIRWDKANDVLFLNVDFARGPEQPITKRSILSAAHKVFDPLGWASPTLLLPKLMLQRLWTERIDWDCAAPSQVENEFRRWYEQLPILNKLRVPRWIFGDSKDDVELHLFVDASKHSYAAALFIRIESSCSVKVHLVQAKSRVGPTSEISIPRMELLAATMGARLKNSVFQALGLTETQLVCWSDSSTVLSWLRTNRQWSRFVWNRIEEIKRITDVSTWRRVPGIMNPADLPSRGCTPEQLLNSRWWEGPAWLKQPRSEWPREEFLVDEELVNFELQKGGKKISKNDFVPDSCTALSCANVTRSLVESPWYMERFSNYNKVVRMIAWINRFIQNSRTATHLRKTGEINAHEYETAEKILFKLAQNESFEGTSDRRLKELNVYLDDAGLVRTKTLISNRDDDFDFRYPAIMDPKHPFTRLLIEHVHKQLKHAGVNSTMMSLRERVWIISCRKAVRSVISKCVNCRRYSAKTLKVPCASLPTNRVRDAAVFEVVGVDYAGPLFLKDGRKSWVCLFTCAVYRAVHFELVTTLSTDGFLESLRRFIARRGRPVTIYSDNGTNFSGAQSLLKALDWEKVTMYCSVEKIEWRFNPPTAAWWGGWWERIVRLLKDLLRRTLRKACLSYEEMSTILCECEAIVNGRPISYVNEDKEKLLPITPEMFLKEIRSDSVPDLDHLEKVSINRRLKYRQRLREELRKRFRSEYLGQLNRHAKVHNASAAVKVGDVVLLASDNLKRMDWPLARVVEVVSNKEGVSRIARVKTANGVLVRPLQRLVVLESQVTNPTHSLIEEDTSLNAKFDVVSGKPQEVDETNCNSEEHEEFGVPKSKCTRSGRKVKVPKRFSE